MSDSEEQKLRQIFESARELAPVDRADLIERIYGTFDVSGQDQVDQKWASEAEERLQAYRTGKLDAEPVEQAMKRLNNPVDS